MKKNKRHYKKAPNVFAGAIIIHIVIECMWGVMGLSFGKLIFGFISGSVAESGVISDITSIFVSAISSVTYSKHKQSQNKSP